MHAYAPILVLDMSAPIKKPGQQTGNAKHLLVIVVVILVVCGVLAFAASKPSNQQATPQVEGTQTTKEEYVAPEDTAPATNPVTDTTVTYYPVTSVSDGDTIKVTINGKTDTVRLIGVDTPETKDPRKPVQCYGKQASDFTAQQLNGTSVRLEPDSSQQERDKYGRLLRYVYMQNGTLFNQRLIESGFAYEYTYQNNPYQYQDNFRQAQKQATQQQVGLWSPQTCSGKR